jgi:hypothetical protein
MARNQTCGLSFTAANVSTTFKHVNPRKAVVTHDCMAMHTSNSIIKFADDTTAVGFITNNDKMAYR